MPAKRIPWFKLWIGATRHKKVAPVSDRTFRVWCELLDAAGEQKKRGRFESVADAAAIIRRKESEVRLVVTAGLMDETPNGAEMHDWDEWQRWRAEDMNDDPSPPDEPTNDSPTTRNGHANHNGTTHEQRLNDSAIRVGAAAPASGEERREKKDEIPPTPLVGGRNAVLKPKPERRPITDQGIEDLIGKYAERYGNRQAVRDEIDQALNHQARFRAIDERLYVDGWLRRELDHRPGWRVLNGRGTAPTTRPVDRTGVAN